MKHQYKITGMTCNGCLNNVKHSLQSIEEVENVDIDLKGDAQITMSSHIDIEQLKEVLSNTSFEINSIN
jgi:copper chaperone CopZ